MGYNKDYFFLILILILSLYLYKLYQVKEYQDANHNNKMLLMTTFIKHYKKHVDTQKQVQYEQKRSLKPIYNENIEIQPHINHSNHINHINQVQTTDLTTDQMIRLRDQAVVKSALYPPLNRMPRPLIDSYIENKKAGIFDVATRYSGDTYKLMGYLINSVNKDEKWNIYGRQKYSGSSQGKFYAIQQCNKDPCVKIDLTNDIMEGDKINDYYNLPAELKIKSPLFNTDPYAVVQLKTSIDYTPYF